MAKTVKLVVPLKLERSPETFLCPVCQSHKELVERMGSKIGNPLEYYLVLNCGHTLTVEVNTTTYHDFITEIK